MLPTGLYTDQSFLVCRFNKLIRGEIATRIISTARELEIETFSIYTTNDITHTLNASKSIQITSPASYLNISELIEIVKKYKIDAIHPGYGFLSESADFAQRMWDECEALVIGPGPEVLTRTGDKLRARLLAEECQVPVLAALKVPTNEIDELANFASLVGYPIVIKAVDGGGGRGIRIVKKPEDLATLARLAMRESPSGKAFAEKAAIDGFRHVEVQVRVVISAIRIRRLILFADHWRRTGKREAPLGTRMQCPKTVPKSGRVFAKFDFG